MCEMQFIPLTNISLPKQLRIVHVCVKVCKYASQIPPKNEWTNLFGDNMELLIKPGGLIIDSSHFICSTGVTKIDGCVCYWKKSYYTSLIILHFPLSAELYTRAALHEQIAS